MGLHYLSSEFFFFFFFLYSHFSPGWTGDSLPDASPFHGVSTLRLDDYHTPWFYNQARIRSVVGHNETFKNPMERIEDAFGTGYFNTSDPNLAKGQREPEGHQNSIEPRLDVQA